MTSRTAIYFGILAMTAAIVWYVAYLFYYSFSDNFTSEALVTLKGRRLLLDDLRLVSWVTAVNLACFSLPTGVVAALGWQILHRNGARPSWIGYTVLALFVLVMNHAVFLGLLLFGAYLGHAGHRLAFIGGVFFLISRGWLSVPVALSGIALFVTWDRRRQIAVDA